MHSQVNIPPSRCLWSASALKQDRTCCSPQPLSPLLSPSLWHCPAHVPTAASILSSCRLSLTKLPQVYATRRKQFLGHLKRATGGYMSRPRIWNMKEFHNHYSKDNHFRISQRSYTVGLLAIGKTCTIFLNNVKMITLNKKGQQHYKIVLRTAGHYAQQVITYNSAHLLKNSVEWFGLQQFVHCQTSIFFTLVC